jgi:DNA-binding NarL/FixJ family response regulator
MKPDALITVLRLIIAGESYMPAAMRARHGGDKQLYLTRREQHMLDGLRAGLSNQEIADDWQLSVVTVKHHIKSLRSKLGARNRVHAVCRANELQI